MERKGLGHWKEIKEFNLRSGFFNNRTHVDLKDRFRNLVATVSKNKNMRGVNLSHDLRLRVLALMQTAIVDAET